jgi:predicted nicotinamide N-methyase
LERAKNANIAAAQGPLSMEQIPHFSFPVHWRLVELPEGGVSLYVPDAEAVENAFRQGELTFPYWSQVWPAARALAATLQRNPTLVGQKTVLELGAGLGLPSLVAAHYATKVQSTDIAQEAVTLVAASAKRNGLANLEAEVLNWTHLPPGPPAEVVLLSDVNYAPADLPPLQQLLLRLLREGVELVLSTPQRIIARQFLEPLLPFIRQSEEQLVQHGGGEVACSVLTLKGE